MMKKKVVLLVGTNKGVFFYTSDLERKQWELSGPFLAGWEAFSVLGDSRHGKRIFAGVSHAAYGPTIRVSDDMGASWRQIEQGPEYSIESGFKLNRIWQLVSGAEAGLFVSHDRGTTWRELDGLTKHPTRPGWFPGAGGMCLHTIIIHPQNPKRIWVAMSAVGVFRTDDGGETWETCNRGLARVPTGQPYPEVGYCIHKMVLDPKDPNILYMQEHSGVFQSVDGGDTWFSIEEGLKMNEGDAPFGFPIGVSPTGDLFLVPLESSEIRSMKDGKLLVHRMQPGGNHWEPIGDVLPDEQRHVNVLRDAFAVDGMDPYGIYFGTTSGELFCSLDRGESWERLPGQLSRILAVKPWILEASDED
jgi:photosystem II stability/assembly factor-like uncharacterized protein